MVVEVYPNIGMYDILLSINDIHIYIPLLSVRANLWLDIKLMAWKSAWPTGYDIDYVMKCLQQNSLVNTRHRVNTWRPRQDGSQYLDDIFKCILFKENV